MTTWSLRRIWRSQCAREVKNIITNKNDIYTWNYGYLLWISQNRLKRDYCRLDNSLKLVLDLSYNRWKKVGLTNYSNHCVVDHA